MNIVVRNNIHEKAVENSTRTVVGRPFVPGVSGNPGGRPKGLASYIRETTDGGREMVNLMVAVMRGETINGMRPKITDMVAASTWLADRGFGKPVSQILIRIWHRLHVIRPSFVNLTVLEVDRSH